jgi:hypothetical protein
MPDDERREEALPEHETRREPAEGPIDADYEDIWTDEGEPAIDPDETIVTRTPAG